MLNTDKAVMPLLPDFIGDVQHIGYGPATLLVAGVNYFFR
jgi:hypothetical protein